VSVVDQHPHAEACRRRDLIAVPGRFGVDATGTLVSGGFATSAHRRRAASTGRPSSASATCDDVLYAIDIADRPHLNGLVAASFPAIRCVRASVWPRCRTARRW